MVIGVQEELDVTAQVVMAGIVVAVHGRFLERAVHAFHLTIGPGMVRPGQPVLDAVLLAGIAEGVAASGARLLTGDPGGRGVLTAALLGAGMGELDAIVGEQGVDPVGHGLDQGMEEVGRDLACRLLVQLGKGELAGAIDGHEQVELASLGADLGDIEMEVADRVGLEALPAWLFALGDGQAGDGVTLQAAVQAGAGQLGDTRLQGIQAVVERQQGMAAEGDDHGFLLGAEHGGSGLAGAHRGIVGGLAPAPLLDGGGAYAMAQSECPYARLTPLYGETDCRCRCGAAVENLAHSSSLAACRLSVSPHPGTEHLDEITRQRLDQAAETAKEAGQIAWSIRDAVQD